MDRKTFFIRFTVVLVVILITGLLVIWKLKFDKTKETKSKEVNVPTIVGGELLLPKVDLTLSNGSGLTGGGALLEGQIWVLSANLVGIFKQESTAPRYRIGTDSAQTEAPLPQLSGIRILGQMYNPGKKPVTNFLPIVRFLDNDNNLKTQKIAHYSQNFDFYALDPDDRGVYDITVDDPPLSDKIEVVLKPQEGDKSRRQPVLLRVASRSSEIQPVQMQNGETVDTYLVTGEVVNITDTSVADILVNAYILDKERKVFGLASEDFKSDLIRPGETIPFKILVLPVKTDTQYDETLVEVWGREYKL